MTDNEKYVKCGQALIIWDDPERHMDEMAANPAPKLSVRCQ